jgi:hypothetical protein
MRHLLLLASLLAAGGLHAQEHGNLFGDPFEQVTDAMKDCPVPKGPDITREEFRQQEHVRVQHGTSCYRVGRCRLPNSYLYDKEIVPRAVTYIREDGRFADTSLWVLGERRIITLMGCVRDQAQADELERTVKLIDDVMGVVPQLMVGTHGRPPYAARVH